MKISLRQNRMRRLLLVLVAAFTLYGLMNSHAGAQSGQARAPQTPSRPTPVATQTPTQASPRPTPAPLLRPSSAAQSTPSVAPDDEEEIVRVNTDLTSILFTAVDKNQRFITTLRREDVRVLEDNAPQTLFTFDREADLPLSLAILIDVSRSQERTLPDEKEAANAFVNAVIRPEKDTASVIPFAGKATLAQEPTSVKDKLRAAIDSVRVDLPPDNPECEKNVGSIAAELDARCGTSIWDVIWSASNEVLAKTPERTRRAIILLSDGDDTTSELERKEAINFATKTNVFIYAIGIGDTKNYSLKKGDLRSVAESTGGRAFFPKDKSELSAAFAQIEQELRSQYLVAYSPTNKNRNGAFRQVRLEIVNPELRKQKLRLLYRQGYYARSTPAAPSK
ncbi:MAG: VWA domain-containing protein [Pyrinomonadaceae bacterium]